MWFGGGKEFIEKMKRPSGGAVRHKEVRRGEEQCKLQAAGKYHPERTELQSHITFKATKEV